VFKFLELLKLLGYRAAAGVALRVQQDQPRLMVTGQIACEIKRFLRSGRAVCRM